MISHEYRCIFIHIPKCAGTSIERAFGHSKNNTKRRSQDHRTLRMLENPIPIPSILGSRENFGELLKRLRYRYKRHNNPNNSLTVSAKQFRDYYKFSFVRNPWARVYSWYNNVVRDKIQQRNLKIPADISFHDFVERFIGKGMLRSQMYWLRNFRGEVGTDFIGRFENLYDDFQNVCCELGRTEIKLPHEIKGESTDYRSAYKARTIEKVARFYAEEISNFGYRFDN